jgi:hypothetical protein
MSSNVHRLRILLIAGRAKGGSTMLKAIIALAIAGLILTVVPWAPQAAPISPLTAEVTAQPHMAEVHWIRRCWRSHLGVVHCRRALGL